MMRTRPIATTVLCALAGGAALAPAAASAARRTAVPTAQRPCHPAATRLPDLGFGGEADAIRGDTIVGSVNTDYSGGQVPALWRDGRLTVIGRFHSGFAGDINANGEVVGPANDATTGFVYLDGAVHLLPGAGLGFIYPRRINDRGEIAGAVGSFAARWDSYTSEPVPLMPVPGDASSIAEGINDAGMLAGASEDANGVPYATVWSPSGRPRLVTPGFGAGEPGRLFAISNRGEAIGESFSVDADGNLVADQATSWTAGGRPTLIPFLPGTNQSTALNVSDRGWVVGGAASANYETLSLGPTHAFVWFGRGPTRALPVPGLSYDQSQSLAHGLDSEGDIVGSSGTLTGASAATVWRCA